VTTNEKQRGKTSDGRDVRRTVVEFTLREDPENHLPFMHSSR